METTICPWCQTEIVWDEEIGPEEECPYCHNELKGYRTLSISLANEEDVEDEPGYEEGDDMDYGDGDVHTHYHVSNLSRVQSLSAAGEDLLAYESAVEQILDAQDDVPECPHCREYMLHAGHQTIGESELTPIVPAVLRTPLLQNQVTMNVYVCSACFHVSRFLSEEDRLFLIRAANVEQDNR